MKLYAKIQTAIETGFTCDCCGVTYTKDTPNGMFEVDEKVSIDFVGGYGSIFGDGRQIKLDLCQACVVDTLGALIEKRMRNEKDL